MSKRQSVAVAPKAAVRESDDEGYAAFERLIAARGAEASAGPLFTTTADPDTLWSVYLAGILAERRQHYTCHACRTFVKRFGGLVSIGADGSATPALWSTEDVPEHFRQSVAALSIVVGKAKVTGVFLSSDPVWGTPRTGEWSHLSGRSARVFKVRASTAGQAMAEKREDFGILTRGLADFPKDAVVQAVRVLKTDAVYRSEKALGVAEWFLALHEAVAGKRGQKRANVVWAAVASAPPGFCHVRSTVISTLLDDIVAGMEFGAISRRWAEKMHPLQYQRPTAPPKSGTIAQAEKLVETLGLTSALDRRYATLDDVLAKVWTPVAPVPERAAEGAGVFDHLRTDRSRVQPLDLPAVAVTWDKFSRTVLPAALSVEVLAPHTGGYFGLVSAADPDAAPILQWDGLVGHARNPVSWYFYSAGSRASQWGLSGGAWAKVNAVFLSPHQWQEPEKFTHQGQHVFFAVEGCRDSNNSSLALFPETLKSELHGIRAVVEAHSRSRTLQGSEAANANGLAFQKGGDRDGLTLRVRTREGSAVYKLDRWD